VEGFVKCAEGLGPILPKTFHGALQALLFALRESWQKLVTQAAVQHIQITTQTCSPGDNSNSPHAHAVGKIQSRGELPHGRAQPPEAHPELMQRLGVAVSENLSLQVA
jgi:hypothetical protein